MKIIETMVHNMEKEMSSSIFTWKSVYGLLIVLLILFLFYVFFGKFFDFIVWVCFLLLFLQIMHVVGNMQYMKDTIPIFHSIFRYDVFQALAQLCVGTPISKFLLFAQAFLNFSVTSAFTMLFEFLISLYRLFADLYHWN